MGQQENFESSREKTRQRRALQPLWNALGSTWPTSQRGILCVSGGPDSRALLESHASSPRREMMPAVVAVVDHQQHPQSDEDAHRTILRAQALGYEATLLKVTSLKSDEHSLRTVRLEALQNHANSLGYTMLVMAHHENDVAESYLMKIVGRGGAGDEGFLSLRNLGTCSILRPFLELSKQSLREALVTNNIHDTIIDPSDLAGGNCRSRMRHRVFPLLQEENPSLVTRLSTLYKEQQEDADYLEKQAALLWTMSDSHTCDMPLPQPPALLRRACKQMIKALQTDNDIRNAMDGVRAICLMCKQSKQGEIHISGLRAYITSTQIHIQRYQNKL